MPPSIAVFADDKVGLYCTQWLIENHRSDLTDIVTTSRNEIYHIAVRNGINAHIFKDEASYLRVCNDNLEMHDLGLLLWWPKIISPAIISTAKLGFINTHPSLLPFSRGKHYNFWALVEQSPFGVSLHQVEKAVDCGAIVAQQKITYTWEDTGETLYHKAIAAMKELFIETYPSIRELDFTSRVQDLSRGSFHLSSELEAASKIPLDTPMTARHLLNLMRARTFEGHPGCSFCDNGVEYEVRIKITKRN